jgi:hypothetical protein
MHSIVPYARTAYAIGWATSGGPLSDRVKTRCESAIRYAIDHADDPHVLEATLKLGSLEGVWAAIFDRRARLYADNVAKVAHAWKTLVSSVDVATVVRTVRQQAGLSEAKKDKTTAAYATTLILVQLSALMLHSNWLALRAAVEDALASGSAEGQADAMALLADQVGATGFDFAKAFADAKAQLGTGNPLLASTENWLGQLINEVATAAGDALAQSIADGEDPSTLDGVLGDFLDNPEGPMNYVLDTMTHLGISAGILRWYQLNGVYANIWFITAGDEKVCNQCDDAEVGSPYVISDVPAPPLHPNCRCSLYTDESMSANLVDSYVD